MTPEGRVKQDVRRWLEAHKIYRAGHPVYHQDSPEILGWYYMPVQNGMGVVGVPDFICCIRGRFVSIETKADERKLLTRNQEQRRDEIVAASGRWLRANSVADLESLAQEFDLHG